MMPKFEIFSGENLINTIVADENFTAEYCAANGYTYNELAPPTPEPPSPTTDERVAALESENAMLKAQVNAQSDQMDFYEDCIAEMAAVVYA